MKIEALLLKYLSEKKSLSLQYIGYFEVTLEEQVDSNQNNEIDLDGKVQFNYDHKAKEDQDFIQYIMAQSKKIYPLAQSDLESYAILAKQFLNLGKPVILHGIGRLIKKQDETYVLLPAGTNPMLHDEMITIQPDIADQKEGLHAQKIDFSSPSKANARNNKLWPLLILTGLIAISIITIFYFSQKETEPNQSTDNNSTISTITDSNNIIINRSDSAALSKKITAHRLILGEYPNLNLAEKMKHMLDTTTFSKSLEVIATDSFHYRLELLVNTSVTDSAKLRDSIQRIFGSKIQWKN
jgi:hypothetical protein